MFEQNPADEVYIVQLMTETNRNHLPVAKVAGLNANGMFLAQRERDLLAQVICVVKNIIFFLTKFKFFVRYFLILLSFFSHK